MSILESLTGNTTEQTQPTPTKEEPKQVEVQGKKYMVERMDDGTIIPPVNLSELKLPTLKAWMKVILDSEPKEMIILRPELNDREGEGEEINVNHYTFFVQKGEPVNVPRSVAQVIRNTNKGVNIKKLIGAIGNVEIMGNK